ncbi:MAG: tetratricopeptide repeat protein [Proteobacteria bacterium]|nr:tetratricopeptide repeat protein [Pseudomonadota bacterium]
MMRYFISVCAIFTVLAVFPLEATGDSLDSLFNDANNAFWNGEYKKAASLYSKIEELGVRDAALSYNLGTTYTRLGKLGTAVKHYERALRLDPGHVDTHHNLSRLREFLARRASEAGRDADLAPAASPWRAALDRFSPSSAAIGFLVFHLALFTLLTLRRFVSSEMPRLSLGVLAGVLGILTATTLAVVVGKWHQHEYVKEAVVVTQGRLDVMEGPASTVKRFALEEGSRIHILEEKENWIRLLDSEDRDGWAPSVDLGKI